MKKTKFSQVNNSQINIYILFIFFLSSTNSYSVNIKISNYFSNNKNGAVTVFVHKITNASKVLASEIIDKSKNTIYNLIGPRKKDVLNKAIKITAIAALTSVTIYTTKKLINNKQNKQKELEQNNAAVNAIIENLNINSQKPESKPENNPDTIANIKILENNSPEIKTLKNNTLEKTLEHNKSYCFTNNKWALWPNDMPFLSLLQIPQEMLCEKLVSEIRSIYKSSNQENIDETKYLIEIFAKDLENEISEYQKKYNIILISDKFEKKQECLLKIKDNIKKLIYLKNTATSWANK